MPRVPAVCAHRQDEMVLNVPVNLPNWKSSKLLLPATIGKLEKRSVCVPLFFQLLFVTAVVRVVPLAGEPVAVPVSWLNSKVALMMSSCGDQGMVRHHWIDDNI